MTLKPNRSNIPALKSVLIMFEPSKGFWRMTPYSPHKILPGKRIYPVVSVDTDAYSVRIPWFSLPCWQLRTAQLCTLPGDLLSFPAPKLSRMRVSSSDIKHLDQTICTVIHTDSSLGVAEGFCTSITKFCLNPAIYETIS